MNYEDISKEFIAAGIEYCDLEERGLGETDEAWRAWKRMIDHAPRSFMDEMREKAVEFGLLPSKPFGYSSDGRPVYSLAEVAECAGMPIEEAQRLMEEVHEEMGKAPIPLTDVSRTQ